MWRASLVTRDQKKIGTMQSAVRVLFSGIRFELESTEFVVSQQVKIPLIHIQPESIYPIVRRVLFVDTTLGRRNVRGLVNKLLKEDPDIHVVEISDGSPGPAFPNCSVVMPVADATKLESVSDVLCGFYKNSALAFYVHDNFWGRGAQELCRNGFGLPAEYPVYRESGIDIGGITLKAVTFTGMIPSKNVVFLLPANVGMDITIDIRRQYPDAVIIGWIHREAMELNNMLDFTISPGFNSWEVVNKVIEKMSALTVAG